MTSRTSANDGHLLQHDGNHRRTPGSLASLESGKSLDPASIITSVPNDRMTGVRLHYPRLCNATTGPGGRGFDWPEPTVLGQARDTRHQVTHNKTAVNSGQANHAFLSGMTKQFGVTLF